MMDLAGGHRLEWAHNFLCWVRYFPNGTVHRGCASGADGMGAQACRPQVADPHPQEEAEEVMIQACLNVAHVHPQDEAEVVMNLFHPIRGPAPCASPGRTSLHFGNMDGGSTHFGNMGGRSTNFASLGWLSCGDPTLAQSASTQFVWRTCLREGDLAFLQYSTAGQLECRHARN
jgi:hypothetical protein